MKGAPAPLAVLLVLGSWDEPRSAAHMTDGVLAAELRRRRVLVCKAYDNKACRAAPQEQQRRFLARSGDGR